MSADPLAPPQRRPPPPSPATVRWLAAACGLAVATLYYNQPMLPLMGASFGRQGGDLGSVAMLTQVGYAAGLLLFGPLGDSCDRRRLILALLAVNAASLLASATAPSFPWLLGASMAIGLTAVTAQVIIPALSGLVPPDQRGKTVGTLISGLVAGQLLARTASGIIGQYAGWRVMFVIAAVLDMVLVILVRRALPSVPPESRLSYVRLLGSMRRLICDQPLLREASASGFLMFGALSALWGSLAFLLSQPPYGLGSAVAGMFGLVGLAGMSASPTIGRLTDGFGGRPVATVGAALIVAAFAVIALAPVHLAAVATGVLLLDLGSRAGLIANQSRLQGLGSEARSRVNTVFMTSYFAGGAVGSAAGAVAAANRSWAGVAVVGALFAAAALVALLLGRRGALRRNPASD